MIIALRSVRLSFSQQQMQLAGISIDSSGEGRIMSMLVPVKNPMKQVQLYLQYYLLASFYLQSYFFVGVIKYDQNLKASVIIFRISAVIFILKIIKPSIICSNKKGEFHSNDNQQQQKWKNNEKLRILIIKIIIMFIDSPDFFRRKVLLNPKSSAFNKELSREGHSNLNAYEYGMERVLLAQHVNQSLNSHDQDMLILEKFRKEADQLKHQKWLAKKITSQTPKISQQKGAKSNNILSALPIYQQNPQIIDNRSVFQLQALNKFEKKQRNTKYQKSLLSEYQKLLKQKDKELYIKNKKLKKSKVVIQKMSNIIHDLKKERANSQQKESLQIARIKEIIEDINDKIVQNRVMFREELLQMKLNMDRERNKPEDLREQTRNLKYKNHLHSQKNKKQVVQYKSEKFIPGPSILYDMETSQTTPIELFPANNKNLLVQSIIKAKESQVWLQNKLSKKAFKQK